MGLQNYQYNRILREYDSRRQQAKWELDQRTEQVYARLPELEQLDQELISGSIQCARLVLSGEESALDSLRERNEALSARKKDLLRKTGFPENYLEPWYCCSDCQDTGHIGNQKCHCFKQAIVDLLYDQSNLRHSLERENFDTFRLTYYSDDYTEESTGLTPRANARRALATCLLMKIYCSMAIPESARPFSPTASLRSC